MKTCSCKLGNRDHLLDIARGDIPGLIFCSKCDCVLICNFGDQRHPPNIVTINSYACWEHWEEAKAKAEQA